jgi:hypothetical protein
MTSDNGLTSISELRRTLIFIAKACAVGLVLALVINFSMLDERHTLFSEASLRIVAMPILLVTLIGALLIFPVGWFKTFKWWLLMPREFSSKAGILDRIYFPFSALIRPTILADPHTEARQKMIDALKWSGAGCLLILIAVSIGTWYQATEL